MPSFQDSAIIFVLALLLFGPKKLPVLARELGKWINEFRRASNEFKMQMEEELRISEQADRQKEIAAMEAAAPAAPALEGVPTEEPEHPHLPSPEPSEYETYETADTASPTDPLPIATSGELKIMPPSTGLPTPQTSTDETSAHDDLGPLIDSIPAIDPPPHHEEPAESTAHG
jgi:sec-independent protein translocase protein TatB